MLPWEKPAFRSPFELWKEDGVLHLVVAENAHLGMNGMKEVVRVLAALDPTGKVPVLMECREQVRVDEAAREMLRRVCGTDGNPVALFTHDLDCRLQGEIFKRVQRPAFPFRVFGWRDEACRWVRERKQLTELVPKRKAG